MAGNFRLFVSAAVLSGALLAGCSGDGEAAQGPGAGQAPPPTGGVVTPPPVNPGPANPAPGQTPPPPPVTGVTGTATLNWNTPTEFTDGSLLPTTELAGFRVYHGETATDLTSVAEVDSRSTTLTVKDLATGTHYFAVAAVSATGEDGALSEVLSKTVM